MRTVSEVSKLTGVSVRTLRYYDNIGLLKPTAVTGKGYRLYGSEALKRLQVILLFRELEFSLGDIKDMLESPEFDLNQALDDQIRLFETRINRDKELIELAKSIKRKGVIPMDFEAFDKKQFEQYKKEAREKWGSTPAYVEFKERAKDKSDGELMSTGSGIMEIFRLLGQHRGESPTDPAVQELIARLQTFITDNYYTCTNEILRGLGEIYVSDRRFLESIDKAGDVGTAQFASEAIKRFCS